MDSLLLTFMQLLTYVTGIVITKLISIALSLEEYGTYSAINVILSIASSFTLLGLGDCINYYYNSEKMCKSEEERIQYVDSIYLAQTLVGIVVAIVLLLYRNTIADYFGNPTVGILICIVCIKPWFENAIHLYQVLFVSVGKAKVIAIRNFILTITKVCIVYVSLHIMNRLSMVFILLVVCDILQLFIFHVAFSKAKFRIKLLRGSVEKFPEIFKYGIPMGIYFIGNTLMKEVDKLVVGKFSSQSDLAVYANCSKTLPLNILVTAFATVLVPYIMQYVSAKEYRKAADLFKNYMKLGYLSIWMLCGAVLVCAEQIIPFLYSDEYLEGLPVFVIYIIVGMLQFGSMHLIITANGDSMYLMKLSLGTLGFNAVFSVVLYGVFQRYEMAVLGPAIATLLITTFYTCIIFKKSMRILEIGIADLLDLRHMFLYLLQLICLGLVAYGIKIQLIEWGMNRYIVMIMICILYFGIIFLLHLKEYANILKKINSFKLMIH